MGFLKLVKNIFSARFSPEIKIKASNSHKDLKGVDCDGLSPGEVILQFKKI